MEVAVTIPLSNTRLNATKNKLIDTFASKLKAGEPAATQLSYSTASASSDDGFNF